MQMILLSKCFWQLLKQQIICRRNAGNNLRRSKIYERHSSLILLLNGAQEHFNVGKSVLTYMHVEHACIWSVSLYLV